MKRIGLILIAILLLAFPVFSQIVSIPDTIFLFALIEEGVDTNEDSQISFSEAEVVTKLDVSGKGNPDQKRITDLTGIESFINVDTLNCNRNDITGSIKEHCFD